MQVTRSAREAWPIQTRDQQDPKDSSRRPDGNCQRRGRAVCWRLFQMNLAGPTPPQGLWLQICMEKFHRFS